MEQTFQLIYIAGYGRSGSTILDMLLSQGKQNVGLGELINLFSSGWINNEYCACGQKALDCSFWSKVKNDWEKDSIISIEEYRLIQKKYIRIYSAPKILWNRYFPSKEFRILSRETLRLYEIISNTSGCNVLIDSSKSPYWLRALKNMGIQIGVLHLVRDARNVLVSTKKSFKADPKAGVQKDLKPKSILSTATRWSISNMMVELLKNNIQYVRIRYEDLISNPEGALNEISTTFNVNLQEAEATIKQGLPLKKSHTIAGNRLRMKSEVRFRSSSEDNGAQRRASTSENGSAMKRHPLFFILTFPFLKRYRYL